jgi:hypothetical protein
LGKGRRGEVRDVDAGEIGDDGGDDLESEFEPGREANEVIAWKNI